MPGDRRVVRAATFTSKAPASGSAAGRRGTASSACPTASPIACPRGLASSPTFITEARTGRSSNAARSVVLHSEAICRLVGRGARGKGHLVRHAPRDDQTVARYTGMGAPARSRAGDRIDRSVGPHARRRNGDSAAGQESRYRVADALHHESAASASTRHRSSRSWLRNRSAVGRRPHAPHDE